LNSSVNRRRFSDVSAFVSLIFRTSCGDHYPAPAGIRKSWAIAKGVRMSADNDGSGNGLYLAKLVAAQHQGDITVRSKPAAPDLMECTFTVTFPEYTD
jgi:hypothetical protein